MALIYIKIGFIILFVNSFISISLYLNHRRQAQFSNPTAIINITNSNEFNISNSNKYDNLTRHNEKFLTYLPHDGFNNQGIELENAIFLAWFLNRTLIIPPILYFVGVTPIIAQPYDKLYDLLSRFIHPNNNFKENKITFCFSEDKTESNFRGIKDVQIFDANYNTSSSFQENQRYCKLVSYTLYNWENLIDFSFVRRHIKYIHRRDFNFKHLVESLNIDPNTEVYNVSSDEYPYQVRYYDSSESKAELGKYKKRVNLITLSKKPQKLMHFGNVFSSTRIIKELQKSKNFWKKLMNKMLPNNPIIINVVNTIVDKIGGMNSFIGVHARLGDGYFVKNQNKTVQGLIKRIQKDFKVISIENHKTSLPSVIFLATDVKRNDTSLQPFFQTFPCVYTLDDFADLLEPLKFLKNPEDGMIMYKFLTPLVDLLVISRSSKFYKTNKSTFSSYAGRLHKISDTF
ncbi:21795_t:CDS:1 [Dentiscutata erythropus]|uniref:21795_t:CDS:1 n=1 Tax=Dentiscutata erythropus TaxID=1348616 RepID=A0A9N9IVW5_9GLOM|nr:21795_t:CDS:1 [Dentiscutata erythropus]